MDWSKVAAGHLQIWHYATNFQNYLQPLPDFDELGPDMLYYKKHGVSGVFVEGDYQNGEPDLEPMRHLAPRPPPLEPEPGRLAARQ